MSNKKIVKNVTVYFDGFNLYHAIDSLNKDYLKWLNYRHLAETFITNEEQLHKVYLFTSLTNMTPEKTARNQLILDASRAVGFKVLVPLPNVIFSFHFSLLHKRLQFLYQ